MARSKGLGSLAGKTSKSLGLDRIDRPNAKRVKGIYPSGDDAGVYGGRAYPTILEQYNRESDYTRWRTGQQYYQGIGQQFSDLQYGAAARIYTETGTREITTITTKFPSKTSNDFSWVSARRMRGDVCSLVPFTIDMARLDQNPADPSQDRLIVNARALFLRDQFQPAHCQLMVGDQLEDGFISRTRQSPLQGLAGSIALTLVAIDADEQTLSFDLSRPYGRVATPQGNMRWTKLSYNPADPYLFEFGRHLGTANRFYCTCPDYCGAMLANSQAQKFSSAGRRFPLPPASRTIRGDYEREMIGFEKRWRDLPLRIDERRECKHIHCLRWQNREPWREPNDEPLDSNEGLIGAGVRKVNTDPIGNEVFNAYYANRDLDWNNIVQAAAGAIGYNMSPVGDMSQRTTRPQLWILDRAPEPEHVRMNDMWLKRGTKQIQIANRDGEWDFFVTDRAGNRLPIVRFVDTRELEPPAESN